MINQMGGGRGTGDGDGQVPNMGGGGRPRWPPTELEELPPANHNDKPPTMAPDGLPKDDDLDDPPSKKLKTDRTPGKPKNTIVWNHVIVTELPGAIHEQKCKYCGKTKMSKQLQTTFWTMHLVDPVKGCPNCPLEHRQELAANSRSADVLRAASQISDQTPAMLAAKLNPPIRRRKKTDKLPKEPGTAASRSKMFANQKKPTIVGLCGSHRAGSFNKMLYNLAMQQIGAEGAIVKEIDLRALNLPIYDADLERDDFPEAAKQLKKDLVAADGIFICSPEYNGFCTPLLLNAITWATRGEGRMYAGFKEKVVLLMSASPGTMGGIRCLRSLQQMMQDMGAFVVPGNNSIGNAFQTFDRDGQLCDERALRKVEASAYQMVRYSRFHTNRDGDVVMDDNIMRMHNMGEYGRVDW